MSDDLISVESAPDLAVLRTSDTPTADGPRCRRVLVRWVGVHPDGTRAARLVVRRRADGELVDGPVLRLRLVRRGSP